MNIKEIFEKPRHVALYQEPKSGMVFIGTYWGKDDVYYHSSDVRLSQPLEVRFDQMPRDQMIQGAVAALDAAELKVRDDMQRQINEIRERKQSLLALSHETDIA